MNKVVLIYFFMIASFNVVAQKQWANWYFNGQSLMTFRSGIPVIQTNFINPPPSYWYSYAYSSYYGIAYADPVTADTKFLLSGRFAYDKNFDLIQSSLAMRACPGDQYSFHIIPFKNKPNKFYVIQFQSVEHDLAASETGLQVRCPNAIGLGYSTLDLSLNNGLGEFENMNVVVRSGLPERITLIRHVNGIDTWVVVHGWNTNEFHAYLFSDTGVSAAITSSIGPVIAGNSSTARGNITTSHDGKTIAAYKATSNTIELYNFDNNTGELSNYRTLVSNGHAGSLTFSPDDTKLYYIGNYLRSGVFQFDFNTSDVQNSLIKLADDKSNFLSDMQVGLDGKIYLTRFNYYDGTNNEDWLSVINCPNLPKYACNYNARVFPYGYAQFPNFINDYIQEPDAPPITQFSLGNDTAVCFGSITLGAPLGWLDYKWNTGATTREISVTYPGLYYVLASSGGFSCPSAYGYINISNKALPLNLGRDTILCPKTQYTLSVPPGFSNILWNGGSTNRNKIITQPGTHILRATDINGCTNYDSITIGVSYYPIADFGKDTILCANQSLRLQLEPRFFPSSQAATYLWQDGSTKDSFRVTQPGQYWGSVTTAQGCTVRDTILVNFVSPQNINIGADTTLCVGDSIRLSVNIPGATYQWSTGEDISEIIVRNTGTYWIKVNSGACTVNDTIKVSFNSKPSIALGQDTVLCNLQKINLSATFPGATYLWQDNSTNNSFLVEQPGIYWAKVSLNGCSNRDSIIVTYKSLPALNLGNDTSICNNSVILLNTAHSSIQSYLWQDNTISPTYLVSQQGTYSISVTGNNGCIKKDTITIAFTPPPLFSLGADTILCEKEVLNITLPLNNASFKWNNGSQKNTITVSQSGLYWVDVDLYGCNKRDSIVIGYKSLPIVSLGRDTIICEGTSIKIVATNNNATYLWQDASTNPSFSVSTTGLYSVKVNLNGCIVEDTILVDVKHRPQLTLGPDLSICTGQQILLHSSSSAVSYLWQNGSTSPSFTITNPGSYVLTATNECGSTTDQINIIKGLCQLLMPSAFTPDNDGKNDIFRVKYPEFIKEFHFSIFDRSGQKIFETTNPTKGWNGKLNNIDQPSGLYIWIINLTDFEGVNQFKKGSIFLVR